MVRQKTARPSFGTLLSIHTFLDILGEEIHNWKIVLIAALWDSLGGGGALFLSWSVNQNVLVADKTWFLPYSLHGFIVFSPLLKVNSIWLFFPLLFCYQVPMGTSWLVINWWMEMVLKIDMQMICLLLRVRNLLIEVIVVQVSYLHLLQ